MSSHALRGRVRGRKKKCSAANIEDYRRLSCSIFLLKRRNFFAKKKNDSTLTHPHFFNIQISPLICIIHHDNIFFFFQFRPAAVKEGNVFVPCRFRLVLFLLAAPQSRDFPLSNQRISFYFSSVFAFLPSKKDEKNSGKNSKKKNCSSCVCVCPL